MKAIVQDRYGDLDVLDVKDIDQPGADDDGVLVRVHAAAVGKGDWLTVGGLPYVARLGYGLANPKHPVPGFDVAGRIETIGPNVTRLHPGDAVLAGATGSFAEYAWVPEGQLAPKPANLTFEQAAGRAHLRVRRPPGAARQRRGQARTTGRGIGPRAGWAASRSSSPRRSGPG